MGKDPVAQANMQIFWSGVVETSRTPSPVPRPVKRSKQAQEEGSPAEVDVEDGLFDEALFDQLISDELISDEALLDDYPSSKSWSTIVNNGYLNGRAADGTPSALCAATAAKESLPDLSSPEKSQKTPAVKARMQTGCIPCLMRGQPCDPRDLCCKLTMSDDWNFNNAERRNNSDDERGDCSYSESMALSSYQPDTKWKRNWRERHSLNFFVNFSAPQMAGFFAISFWQRMVIQASYHEPAILHAITAIGALHEAILQHSLVGEKRKAQAMEFALSQCNRSIVSLTRGKRGKCGSMVSDPKLALTTCVLFTCFEAMQGRCDSAVNHALQGRRLLQAIGRPNVVSMTPSEEDELEQMRPLVERLEVQATALLDKCQRPEVDTSDQTAPLPPIEYIFSLDHAHGTLHTALNSVMRFMQGFHPTAPRDHIAITIAEKYLRYSPWFQRWETAFTAFLSEKREFMSSTDLKRAMVLKANHLVGTMLASVDQSAGPVAYDAYEAEFKAIVDLSREVLATFSCPPLPTLSDRTRGTPYLSFSLWVTDPLWMAISRCRNPNIRQAAFTLLSQNPRQEGIWHAGPSFSNNQNLSRGESCSSQLKETIQDDSPLGSSHLSRRSNEAGNLNSYDNNVVPDEVCKAQLGGNMRIRGEWVDLRAQIQQFAGISEQHTGERPKLIDDRYKSHCTGRCSIPRLEEFEGDE